MSLADLIETVERQEKTLRIYNPPRDEEGVVEEITDYFDTQNVRVLTERTESGRPDALAVLTNDDVFLTALPVTELRGLIDSTPTGPSGVGIDDSAYYSFLRHLKETTFTSYDRGQMVAASREIEDRAWRLGEGRLMAGFQHASILAGETDVYERLADKPLDIEVFAVPDTSPPEIDGVTSHIVSCDEIADTWFVVFDGGGEDLNKTALLAEERSANSFYGFWTYDADIVDRILAYLDSQYGRIRQ